MTIQLRNKRPNENAATCDTDALQINENDETTKKARTAHRRHVRPCPPEAPTA